MARTVMQVMEETARQHGSRPALRVQRGDQWQDLSWSDYRDQARQVARGLMALGVERGTGVAILGSNRPEWFLADLGAIYAGAFPSGIYITSSPEQCAYIIDHCEAAVAVVENAVQLAKLRDLGDRMPRLRAIVLMEGAPPAEEDFPVPVMDWAGLLDRAEVVPESSLEARITAQKPDDCCTLIYTSGTTGPPKAVMISHTNFVWVVEQVLKEISDRPYGPEDQMVSYLPLSHVAEQVVSVHAPMHFGGCVWCVSDLTQLVDTLREARPSIFFAVPRVWEKIQARIVAASRENPSALRATIAKWARGVGLAGGYADQKGKRRPLGWPLADRLVFRKVREKLGLDRCRLAVTSAAPIALDTLEFFLSLGIPVCEVYGMSEATGPSTLSVPWRYRTGKAGFAIPGSEIRIAPDGEILMRGPHVFLGYFKEEAATQETLDEEGWLHSGDVGTLDADGFLKITDRKKELFVSSAGKNIAPQVIEGLIKSIPVVMQAVAIGDGRKYLSALLVLDPERLPEELLAAGVGGDTAGPELDPQTVAELPAFRKHLQSQIDAVNARLSRVEQIKRWVVLPGELTVDGGELTPTLKLKRRVILQKYQPEIERLYE